MIPNPVAASGESAAGGNACVRYSVCCQQLVPASTPGSVSAQPACAQLAMLSAMGGHGERACEQGLTQLRASLAGQGIPMPPACAPTGFAASAMNAAAMGPRATVGRGAVIGVGTLTSGSLDARDTRLADGGAADDYTIALIGGRSVTIVTRGGSSRTDPGSTLDVYTILMQNGVEVMHDDDSAGSLNSRIVFSAPSTGLYTIRVTTYGGSLKEGSYTLQTFEGALPSQT